MTVCIKMLLDQQPPFFPLTKKPPKTSCNEFSYDEYH